MWSRRVDFSATLLILLPPLFPLLREAGVRYPPDILKAAAVHLQLVVMVGLTSDANKSVFSLVCRWGREWFVFPPFNTSNRFRSLQYLILRKWNVPHFWVPVCGMNFDFDQNKFFQMAADTIPWEDFYGLISPSYASFQYVILNLLISSTIVAFFLATIATTLIEEPLQTFFKKRHQ